MKHVSYLSVVSLVSLLLSASACSKRPITPVQEENSNFAETFGNIRRIVVGTDWKTSFSNTIESKVRVLDAKTGTEIFAVSPYPSTYRGGIQVGQGDIDDDGYPDILVGPGYGGGDQPVRVISGKDGTTEVYSFFPFGNSYNRAIYPVSADVDGDGQDDIIVGSGPKPGSEALVRVYSGATKTLIYDLVVQAASATSLGFAHVAAADVDGDGQAEIIVARAGAPVDSSVVVYSGATGTVLRTIDSPHPGYKGAIFAGAADIDGDGKSEVLIGANLDGPKQVKIYNGFSGVKISEFTPFAALTNGGSIVSSIDIDGDGVDEVLVGNGEYRTLVGVFQGLTGRKISDFQAFPAYDGGVVISGR